MRQICLLVGLMVIISARTKDEWRNRTIYQLLTDRFASSKGADGRCDLHDYCGGDFKGIEQHLDYIKDLGFDAIWISPIVENYPGAYHGYAAKHLYKMNPNFGTESDFKQLVEACHKQDIWVMVDIVPNHMGNQNMDFTQNYPFNQTSHFHDLCEISDTDFATHNLVNIEKCRLFMLADLNQDNPEVSQMLIDWIQFLVSEYDIDGMRLDTAMMVKGSFWKKFTEASGIYSVGEVFDGDLNFLKQFIGPIDALLNYPLFFNLRDVFLHNKDMYQLESYYNQQSQAYGKQNVQYMGNFNDNHDNARFLSDEVGNVKFSQLKKLQFKAMTAFNLISIGIPIIYYGSEQGFAGGNDPYNREVLWNNMDKNSDLYKYIQTINNAKRVSQAGTQDQIQRYADTEFYAFTRGLLFAAFSNKFDREVIKSIGFHPYSDGTILCNIFYTQDCIKVNNGIFTVHLIYGEVKIFLPK